MPRKAKGRGPGLHSEALWRSQAGGPEQQEDVRKSYGYPSARGRGNLRRDVDPKGTLRPEQNQGECKKGGELVKWVDSIQRQKVQRDTKALARSQFTFEVVMS